MEVKDVRRPKDDLLGITPALAILPFKDRSPEKKGLGEGIAADLIISLSRIPQIHVIARTSSFALEGFSTREAGEQLNATLILEGSVKKDKDQISISVFLFDVASGLNRWSQQYEDSMTELLLIEDDITFKITEILQIGESAGNLRGMHAIHSKDVDAYQYYLRGRKFFYQFSEHDVRFAIRMYKKAIECDPQYALAYSGLADCYSYLYMYSPTDRRNLIQADQSSLVAIKLDPILAGAWSARGVALSLKKKFIKAAECFERSMQLDPMFFDAAYQYARMSFAEGNLQKAISLYAKALDIRPEDYQSPLLAAQSYEVLGQPDKAYELRQKGIAIAEESLRLNPHDTRALSLAANGLVAIGEKEKGFDFLVKALTMEPNDPMLLYNAGCIYAMAGNEIESLDCLERSAATGLTQKEWYIHDDNLDQVRDHPRFKKLIESMN